MDPTLAGFTAFIQGPMGIATTILSPSDPSIAMAYSMAIGVVNTDLQLVPSDPTQPSLYAWAVYNLAGHYLISFVQDSSMSGTFFATLRTSLGVNSAQSGLISSTSDSSTATSFVVPDFAKSMSFDDMQLMKTPWGRAYLALAMKVGTLWGLT